MDKNAVKNGSAVQMKGQQRICRHFNEYYVYYNIKMLQMQDDSYGDT